MMWCFVYLNQSSLLPKPVFPLHFHWRLRSGPVSHGCSCDFACFIVWNWNYNCKVRGNLFSNLYFCKAELVWWAWRTCRWFFFFLNIWPDKVWIDWRTKPPCMNRSILETLLYSAWTDICTAHEGRLNTMISRFGKEDICPMVGEALPCEQAPLYLHSLFVCHVFCLRVISFALMCNANESLIGNWH